MPLKILIIRFSSIGDIVLTTPVVRTLKKQTGAEVHYLTKQKFASILEPNPHIDRVWTIEKKVSEVATELKAVGFDYIIDLHKNLRTLSLGFHLRKCKKYAFKKLNWQKWLLTRWKIDRMPDRHIVDRYMDTVRPLSVTNDGRGLDYFIRPEDRVNLLREGLPERYLAFVIGAAHATKRLEEAQMAEFCHTWNQPIVLLGGPAEAEIGERLASMGDHIYNTCGRMRLGQSADLVKQAQLVLTHDTGLMHIAAAFRKPILSVWGNTVPSFGMYPYLPGQEELEKARRQEVLNLSCRPCSKIGHNQCPKGHFRCMRDQPISDMVAKLRLIWLAEVGMKVNG
ncbi:MAG: glycosyltransferase family 9 protein [Bacteroidota bacterium]